MSLLDTASLIVTPNAYKEGKLYSVIPSNGNGDFSVTRATTATRVNAAGLVELVPYNLFTYSEMFSDSAWAKNGSTIGINATTAPNGTLTADKLTENSSNTRHNISRIIAVNVGAYVYSIYAKQDSRKRIIIREGGITGAYATFDLSTGSIVTSGAGATATIESVENGYYRCSVRITFSSSGNATYTTDLLLDNGSVIADATYLGDGTSGLFIWGAQLNEGTSALDYQMTETRLNIPRLDYSQGSCPALLLEPQRTNLALSSDDLTNATYWSINSTALTSSTTTSILGANNAFIFTETTASATRNIFAQSGNRPTSTSGATYTFSAYFKQGTRRYVGISVSSAGSGIHVFLDTTTWAITDAKRFGVNTNWVYLSSQIVLSPNSGGWYRLSVTFRTDAALTLIPSIFASNVSTSASSEPTYLGDGSTIICGQIQVELGAYPTTYIPTTTATVTRITDAFTRNNIFTNGLITSSGGTWFLELRNNVVYTRDTIGAIWIGDNSTAASLGNSLNIRSSGTGLLPINKCVGGTLTGLYTTLTSTVKIAIKWNGTTADVFVNGTKVVSATAFTTTNMEFLCGQGSDVPKFIQQMALYPTPLSDTDCIALTTL